MWTSVLTTALTTYWRNMTICLWSSTFSKSRSMAGMRIGYALGNGKLIGYLNDVKYSYNSYTMDLTSIWSLEPARSRQMIF